MSILLIFILLCLIGYVVVISRECIVILNSFALLAELSMAPGRFFFLSYSLFFSVNFVAAQEVSVLPADICVQQGSDIGNNADLVHQRSFQGICVNGAGSVFVSEWNSGYILSLDADNKCLMPVAGSSRQWQQKGYLTRSASVTCPRGIATDNSGNIYVAQYNGQLIRRIAPDGTTKSIAGTGVVGYSGDGTPATGAMLHSPGSLVCDNAGNLFFTEEGNHIVRKVAADGIISTVAGIPGIAGYDGNHGLAVSAKLHSPTGIAISANGDIYISDTYNNVVRKITAEGVITNMAGKGEKGYSGDGDAATSAKLNAPHGLAVTGSGDLLIADEGNNVIRKVSVDGKITTYAGAAGTGSAYTVQLTHPRDVAVDIDDNVYVLDFSEDIYHRLHRIGSPVEEEQEDVKIGAASDRYIQIENCRYSSMAILDMQNRVLSLQDVTSRTFRINISMLKPGNYILEFRKKSRIKTVRFSVSQ